MTAANVERRLAAIMFTDIVGYTALMAESEEKGLRVRERHRALVRPLVEKYHGEWIQDVGDETLSCFPSAVYAVNCALAIQAVLSEESKLKVRIGIHAGDVVLEEGSLHGDGVNIAARIRPMAEPGGICVSDEVQHAIRNQEHIETVSLGEHQLKNVGRPVAVFTVRGTPGKPPERTWRRVAERPSRDTIQSLAVLPLENLSGDPDQEYFADGMTEAVISEFARIASLAVISRTSVMQYKRARKPLPEIAHELGVDGVIEGTVMRAGDRVRITAQLIDARSDMHLWSERYDRELSDVLALQSDVARAVAEQVRLELTPEEQLALTARRPVDPEAYDAYLRGRQLMGPPYHVMAWGPQAIAQLERAVAMDPDFAKGWATLAGVRLVLGGAGFNLGYRGEFPRARDAAERALELDARLGAAHSFLGMVRLKYDWDFPGAGRAFERGVQLSPSDPAALSGYASYLLQVERRTEEAGDIWERIGRVAPLDLYWRGARFQYFFMARQYERALAEVERLRELNPEFTHVDIGTTYAKLGRFEDACTAWIEFAQRGGRPFDRMRKAIQRGWAEGGWEGLLRAWLDFATETDGFSPNTIAHLQTSLGETDAAFAWLERGYRERDPPMTNLKSHPGFDPLRTDPRFDDLLRRIGFPES